MVFTYVESMSCFITGKIKPFMGNSNIIGTNYSLLIFGPPRPMKNFICSIFRLLNVIMSYGSTGFETWLCVRVHQIQHLNLFTSFSKVNGVILIYFRPYS